MPRKTKAETCIESIPDFVITPRLVEQNGGHRGQLKQLVENGTLSQAGRGLYVRSNTWDDDFCRLQAKYRRGIFSHETALFLLGFSNRVPLEYSMVFPQGYHAKSLKQEKIRMRQANPTQYALGITEITSCCGNGLRVYDIERTLCDILRGRGCDIQLVLPAMRQYAASKEKDLPKLMQYAQKLHVLARIQRYMEVLLPE